MSKTRTDMWELSGSVLLRLLGALALLAATSHAVEPGTCGAGSSQGKCGFDDGTGTYQSRETGRGAGTAEVPKCGGWCASTALDPNTPCAIAQDVMPCAGEYWCTSTCALWNTSILEAASPTARPLTCEQFIRTSAYPKGGEVCKEECLLAEVRPNRYPAPTGLGFLCAPGTCDPAVQNRYNNTDKALKLGLAILECPCNWFGSDCPDDWVEITAIVRKERLGDFEATVFRVSDEGWHRVMNDHRPGGVVRVQAPSKSAWGDRPLEQPYALANDKETGVVGELEILTGPPEAHYFPTVTEMALRVRAMPVGKLPSEADGKGKLFINPSVAGFFNKRYMFLMDALAADPSVEHVVLVATGAGLSGVRSAIARLLREGGKKLHLYYGLRDVRHLPYRGLLVSWVEATAMSLTLAISSSDSTARAADEPAIAAAVAAGDELRSRSSSAGVPAELRAVMPDRPAKLYVQHALGLSFTMGELRRASATLANTAVVVCGRNEILLDTEAILAKLPGAAELLPQRVFMNI